MAFLSLIPNVTIYSPCGFRELEQCLHALTEEQSVVAVRHPRGYENHEIQWPETSGQFCTLRKRC